MFVRLLLRTRNAISGTPITGAIQVGVFKLLGSDFEIRKQISGTFVPRGPLGCTLQLQR